VGEEEKAKIYYHLPMPPDVKRREPLEVLPIITTRGAEVSIGSTGKDFDLVFSFSI